MAVFADAGTRTGHSGFSHFVRAIILLLVLSAISSVISQLQGPSAVSCSPPSCKLPPASRGPLTATQHYTSSRYGFSLDYSTSNIQPSQTTDSSISWQGQLSDGSNVSWSFTGSPANGRTEQQIAQDTQSSNFPDAQQAYVVPYASLGDNVGYGAVYDVTVSPGDGSSEHDRLLVYAVVRNGLAVVLQALGTYQQSDPSNDSGPNPAAMELVQLGDFEENVNTVTWPGQKGY